MSKCTVGMSQLIVDLEVHGNTVVYVFKSSRKNRTSLLFDIVTSGNKDVTQMIQIVIKIFTPKPQNQQKKLSP